MDDKWEKQNQDPNLAQDTEQQPQTPPNAGQTGGANRPSVPIAFSGQRAYDHYSPSAVSTKNSKKRRVLIGTLLIIAMAVIAGGVYFWLDRKNQPAGGQAVSNQTQGQKEQQPIGEQAITVPKNWKTIDTKLGYTVKAPPNWIDDGTLPTSSDFGGLTSKTVTIGDPERSTTDFFGDYVAATTQSLKGSNSRSELEEKFTNKKSVADAFAVKESQIELTSAKVKVGRKQWLRIDLQTTEKFFETILYYWMDDHAIALIVISDNQADLDKLVNDYLLPMAASVELK